MTDEHAMDDAAIESSGPGGRRAAVGPLAGDMPEDPPANSADLADTQSEPVAVQPAEFASLEGQPRSSSGTPLHRFYDVHVTVWAELGRVQVPLGELLKLSEGSVMRLERPVTGLVDLMAQGVRVARGEVVVVDDCFAIRIKELDPRGKSAPP